MNHTCLYSTAARHRHPLAGTYCAYPVIKNLFAMHITLQSRQLVLLSSLIDFTFWIIFSLSQKFGLRPGLSHGLIQKVKSHIVFTYTVICIHSLCSVILLLSRFDVSFPSQSVLC